MLSVSGMGFARAMGSDETDGFGDTESKAVMLCSATCAGVSMPWSAVRASIVLAWLSLAIVRWHRPASQSSDAARRCQRVTRCALKALQSAHIAAGPVPAGSSAVRVGRAAGAPASAAASNVA